MNFVSFKVLGWSRQGFRVSRVREGGVEGLGFRVEGLSGFM